MGMKHKQILGTALNASVLCLGTSEFGASVSESESYKLMDIFSENGGNFLDTARVYSDWIAGEKGRSERIIGDYLSSRKNRDNWLIGTKGAHPLVETMEIPRLGRKELVNDIDDSLKALRTDYIDIFYLHRDNEAIDVEEIIEWMNEFVARGKIRYFGCSNWKTERMRKALTYANINGLMSFSVNQPSWNAGCYSLNTSLNPTMTIMNKEMIQFHIETKLTVVPYASQANGFFSKLDSNDNSVRESALKNIYATPTNLQLHKVLKELAQKYAVPVSHVVIAYLLSQRISVIPVFRSSSVEQLKDTISAAQIQLLAKELKLLDSVNGFGRI